jgi:hypothetical protein
LLLGNSYLLKVQKSWFASNVPSILALAINWLAVLESGYARVHELTSSTVDRSLN